MITWLSWIAALYFTVGVVVCANTYNREGGHMPIHHFLLLVWFWPLLFIDWEGDDE